MNAPLLHRSKQERHPGNQVEEDLGGGDAEEADGEEDRVETESENEEEIDEENKGEVL